MKLHWISPYSPTTPPNIGGAINSAISQLNANRNDWVIHTDQDTLFLQPDTKRHIYNILSETDYHILGCMTNRIRSKEQLVDGHFNNNPDILTHMAIAKNLYEANGGLVTSAQGIIAAFLMCFKVSTWQALGGFQENSVTFDIRFCNQARMEGYKLGIMRGIYIFHAYRMQSRSPLTDTKHLFGL